MEVVTHHLPDDTEIPSSHLPLLVLPQAVPAEDASSAAMARRFTDNGWQGTWTYTVFDYWHFHAQGHEVLGCVGGEAVIGFGGDGGVQARMRPGDVVMIPAGVGHRRLSASPDFAVVGAYPPGQNGAILRPGDGDMGAVRAQIAALGLPERDPVSGERPGCLAAWKD
ncbi:cupin domain-containing protein [Aurantimonas sp. A2-1-M11]|uniref:cupin domain-containing protein n=1 Tax=Aurantimonas sp. A2-1-M11 TaxID=3113712 RepID=UPI002F937CB3